MKHFFDEIYTKRLRNIDEISTLELPLYDPS